MDLDTSLLLQSDFDPLDTEFSDRGLELDDPSDSQMPPTLTQYTESTTQSAKSERQSLTSAPKATKNPRYQPIVDNGVTYTFEADPLVYKKIRKCPNQTHPKPPGLPTPPEGQKRKN